MYGFFFFYLRTTCVPEILYRSSSSAAMSGRKCCLVVAGSGSFFKTPCSSLKPGRNVGRTGMFRKYWFSRFLRFFFGFFIIRNPVGNNQKLSRISISYRCSPRYSFKNIFGVFRATQFCT